MTPRDGRESRYQYTFFEIEIRPGCDRAPISPDGRGVIPVAVRQTDEFDPTSESVRYRSVRPTSSVTAAVPDPINDGHVIGADRDGRSALLLFFRADETGFDGDESTGQLE